MPDRIRAEAARIARRNGIPVPVFLSLIDHESGWQAHVVSPAGARGYTPLMPATARSLGVNPDDPIQNLEGGARYLKMQLNRFKSMRLALAAYNAGPGNVENGAWRTFAETTRYVDGIMGQARTERAPRQSAPPKVSAAGGTSLTAPSPLASPPLSAPGAAGGLFGDTVANQAFENLGRIGRGTTPTYTLPDLVAASQTPVPAAPASPSPPPSPQPVSPDVRPGAAVTAPYRPGKMGQVSISAGANARGRKINPQVVDFIRQIAGVHGAPITITTGTNHNQYVVGTHRESRHWTGHAVDIAVNRNAAGQVDPKLTRLGQDALIAAGVPPEQARKAQGGVYNLTRGGHRIQILFNTNEGGNHYNHLHVSVD